VSARSERVVETHSGAETEALGAEVAGELRPGDVVLIEGELGSGKTTFVRGAARALGIEGPVASPTFTIGQVLRGDRAVVAHLDLYRLSSLEAEDPSLLDDYLGPDRVTFVEWPAIGRARLPPHRLRVRLSHLGGDMRRVELLQPGEIEGPRESDGPGETDGPGPGSA